MTLLTKPLSQFERVIEYMAVIIFSDWEGSSESASTCGLTHCCIWATLTSSLPTFSKVCSLSTSGTLSGVQPTLTVLFCEILIFVLYYNSSVKHMNQARQSNLHSNFRERRSGALKWCSNVVRAHRRTSISSSPWSLDRTNKSNSLQRLSFFRHLVLRLHALFRFTLCTSI